ncbi:gamma-glutamylcyclotransferase family protein [Serinibacter salmoneus]|uniref:gamma-glutamylcyclotransferase family protein n=1 Tax=Serinibacter salmoneus TaxID=556530 RepID=UPI0014748316|nr:gamma-glutamylcyclotransferase family protein [Serinibacter salmoneus]
MALGAALVSALGVFGCLAPASAGAEVAGYGRYVIQRGIAPGGGNFTFTYGNASDGMLSGDWDGDGRDSLAVRRGRTFYFTNRSGAGSAQKVYSYGNASDEVFVGDWDGDGIDTLAVRRGRTFYFTNRSGAGSAQKVYSYGNASDEVFVGDWDGDGIDTLAVRRGRTFYFTNRSGAGSAQKVYSYGNASDEVFVGDWDGDGADTLAVRRGRTFYQTDRTGPGSAQHVVDYGRATDAVLVGRWDGGSRDILAVRRAEDTPTPQPRDVMAVYGTLRDGQPNAWVMSGTFSTSVTERMPSLSLWGHRDRTFPYAMDDSAHHSVVAEVKYLHPATAAATIDRVDRLERYDPSQPATNQMYVRVRRDTASGVSAWIYLAGPRTQTWLRQGGYAISSGDWVRG